MGAIRCVLGGLIGGAIGVVIWVVVGYSTQYEVGWIAWGVGFLVGVGVRYAAYLADREESFAQGILAAVIAIGSIVTAKFLVFTLLVGGSDAAELRELADKIRFDDEAMIASIADEIAEQIMEKGQTIHWPPGMSYEEASRREDYPPAMWQQAERRWNQLGRGEREERKRVRILLVGALSSEASSRDFGEFFSPWDILWFALATVTAFKIGVGTYGGD